MKLANTKFWLFGFRYGLGFGASDLEFNHQVYISRGFPVIPIHLPRPEAIYRAMVEALDK